MNSKTQDGLLDRVVEAHGGLERWHEVRYLDVRLMVSGGLFQIKGQPEGLHDVLMRIETQRPAVTPFGRPDCRGRVVEERTDPRASFAGHVLTTPRDLLICSTSRVMLIGITSQRRFCSHSQVEKVLSHP